MGEVARATIRVTWPRSANHNSPRGSERSGGTLTARGRRRSTTRGGATLLRSVPSASERPARVRGGAAPAPSSARRIFRLGSIDSPPTPASTRFHVWSVVARPPPRVTPPRPALAVKARPSPRDPPRSRPRAPSAVSTYHTDPMDVDDDPFRPAGPSRAHRTQTPRRRRPARPPPAPASTTSPTFDRCTTGIAAWRACRVCRSCAAIRAQPTPPPALCPTTSIWTVDLASPPTVRRGRPFFHHHARRLIPSTPPSRLSRLARDDGARVDALFQGRPSDGRSTRAQKRHAFVTPLGYRRTMAHQSSWISAPSGPKPDFERRKSDDMVFPRRRNNALAESPKAAGSSTWCSGRGTPGTGTGAAAGPLREIGTRIRVGFELGFELGGTRDTTSSSSGTTRQRSDVDHHRDPAGAASRGWADRRWNRRGNRSARTKIFWWCVARDWTRHACARAMEGGERAKRRARKRPRASTGSGRERREGLGTGSWTRRSPP